VIFSPRCCLDHVSEFVGRLEQTVDEIGAGDAIAASHTFKHILEGVGNPAYIVEPDYESRALYRVSFPKQRCDELGIVGCLLQL
jgi:hypothetical protein